MKNNISGALIGFAMALGFIPLFIASIIQKNNMFIEILDRLDDYWKPNTTNSQN